MLKRKRSSYFLWVFLAGMALLITACEQGAAPTSAGCGESAKEILVSLPKAQEGVKVIDKYSIEVIDPVSSETLAQAEGLPGESKAVAVVDSKGPMTIKVTALDQADNVMAAGETTAMFEIDHDGLFCDMGLSMDLNPTSLSSLDTTIDITMDCHIMDIIEKMVEVIDDIAHDAVEITQYVIEDTVEDVRAIIDIIR